MILATNDLSIYLPFCAKRKNKTKHDFNNSSARVKSPHKQKKVNHPPHKKKTDATINRLQTVCSKKKKKTFRADYLQTVRLGERARCQGEEKSTACEQRRLCWDSESAVLPHRMCVPQCVWSAENYCRLSLPLSFLSLSLSLTCYSRLLLQTSTLQHGCAALNLQMAHAPHISSQVPPFFPSSSHQLARNEEFECR